LHELRDVPYIIFIFKYFLRSDLFIFSNVLDAALKTQFNTEIKQLQNTVLKQDNTIARLNDEMYALKQFASQKLQQIGKVKTMAMFKEILVTRCEH
jgi:hypothetical protein